jgi:hypothetical protein
LNAYTAYGIPFDTDVPLTSVAPFQPVIFGVIVKALVYTNVVPVSVPVAPTAVTVAVQGPIPVKVPEVAVPPTFTTPVWVVIPVPVKV